MVIGKTYAKSIFREIKQSFGRFAAIIGIVTLGVGFLVGLLSTTPDMEISADKHYDENRMMDIFVKATMGLTEEDLEAVASLPGIDTVTPAYVTDAVAKAGDDQLNTRIYGLPLEENDSTMVDRLTLVDGRMPETESECVVQQAFGAWSAPEIGTTIRLLQEATGDEDLTERYATLEFTVVGIVESPFYFASEKERTTVGNGKIDTVIYVPQECYLLDVYTDFYMTISDAKALNTFTDEYEDLVDGYVEQLEVLAEERSEIRFADVLAEAEEALADAQKELDDGQAEADQELADGWQELLDGRKELDDGWKELADGRKELADEIAKAKKEIADGEKELADAEQLLLDGEKEMKDGEKELRQGQQEYEDGYETFKEGEEQYLAGLAQYQAGQAQLAAAWTEIEAGQKQLEASRLQLEQGEKEYAAGKEELEKQKELLEDGKDALDEGAASAMSALGISVSGVEEAIAVLESSGDAIAQGIEAQRQQLQTQLDGLNASEEGLQQQIGVTTDPAIKAELEAQLAAVQGMIAQLEQAISEIPDGFQTVSSLKTSLRSELDQITNGRAEIAAAEKLLEESRPVLNEGWIKYNEGAEKMKIGIEEYNKNKAALDAVGLQMTIAGAEISAGRAELSDARRQLDEAWEELEEGKKELEEGWQEYRDGLKELEDAKITLAEEKAKAQKELADGEQELIDGEKEYADGILEYEEGKLEAEEKLADGRRKLADARQELAELEFPEWYVLDRGSNVTYAGFKINVRKVADVAKVFPVFFFLVSALVTLTTMTRMVEEERTQMGTLKALGYSEWSILLKYLIYCGLGTIIGCVAGVLIGFRILPLIINNAYTSQYDLPPLITKVEWSYVLASCLTEALCTLFATYSICHQSMKEKPALLMLPQAPKAGQRIFLENVRILWKHLSFSWKATVRNIFRYKKHLIMTIIGIGGCTALMLAGFGVKDSISTIANTQFEKIWLFDMRIEVNDEPYDDILSDFLTGHPHMPVHNESGVLRTEEEEYTATIYVPQNAGQPEHFMYLHDRVKDEPVHFDEYSVLLSEKLADVLSLSVGDTFQLENGDEKRADFTVTGITENYAGGYVYIGAEVYRKAYEEVTPNLLLIKSGIPNEEQNAVAEKLLTSENVSNVEFHSQTKSTYDSLLESLGYLIAVLIIAAGALAVIVLYNLTNININERMKELATLRVLGYHNKEVAVYIFREITILSILGTAFGLFVGFWLHRYIILCAETVEMMFGREIQTASFVWSAVLTLIFSAFVNVLMLPKIKKIDMTESMKAVD